MSLAVNPKPKTKPDGSALINRFVRYFIDTERIVKLSKLKDLHRTECNTYYYFTLTQDRTNSMKVSAAETATRFNDNKYWWMKSLRSAIWTKRINLDGEYIK